MSNLRFFYQLPQISSNYIIANSSLNSSAARNNSSQMGTQPIENSIDRAHHEDIKVQSPFYDRHTNHKGNCQCPYHRMKRYKQITQANRHSPNSKMKDQLDLYKSRIAAAVKQAGQINKSGADEGYFSTHKRMFRKTEGQPKKKIQLSPPIKRSRQQLDNYNQLFQQILKMRMLPLHDHQKVNNLLKFIKMKACIDKKYLIKQRDYIELHLMRVVQKIKFNDLLQITDKDTDLIYKIAKIINVKQDFALNFIKAVQTASKDFQAFIIERAKDKQVDQNFDQGKNKNSMDKMFESYKNSIINNENSTFNQNSALHKSIQKQINNKYAQQIANQKIQKEQFKLQGLNSNQQQNDTSQNKSLTSTERKKLINNIKMSIRRSKDNGSIENQYSGQGVWDKNSTVVGGEMHSRFHEEALNKTSGLKVSSGDYDSNRNQDLGHKTYGQNKKSFMRLSKLVGHPKQNEFKENIQEQVEQLGRQFENTNKGQKGKKGKLHNKRKDMQKFPINPFDSLKYAPIVSKQEFERIKYIVSDQGGANQDIKMKKVFALIQKRLSHNAEFFEQFLQKFGPALNQQQIQILKQKYKKHQYERMISKLTKQVDACLMELKHSDEMVWKDEEDDTMTKQRERQAKKRTLQLECMNQNEGLLDQFNKFTIIQKIPVKNSTQPKYEWQLDQKDIGQIQIEQQISILSQQKQMHKEEPEKRKKEIRNEQILQNRSDVIDKAKHKQILKYMKYKHQSMFQQISYNIRDTLSNIDCILQKTPLNS